MTINTLQVGATAAPAVVATFFKHYAQQYGRKKKAKESGIEDPAVDLMYDEGLKVLRAFLEFSAKHTLEETQAFTALYVPCPIYVRKRTVSIPHEGCIDRAEEILEKQLDSYGPESFKRIGGRKWWRVRGRELEGEWIEMKRDYVKRKAEASSSSDADRHRNERVMLYIHGGAYFFSSLDTHRYQIQRHARKLGGRAFSPAYRLAPQYPFPCGVLDSLAAYLFLIDPPPSAEHRAIDPTSIILAGDSAGGGAVLALLMTIRDQGLPMPAGANLFSPWVDLCHSFPSVISNRKTDYIPGNGFHYKSSLAWPPVKEEPFLVKNPDPTQPDIQIDEQIQMYTTNSLLNHPMVSPVNAGSLGGLCPLLIHSGGGELLRDEQIYLAHKAANPAKYPPPDAALAAYPNQADLVNKFKPTKVQLQVYDGCAHVIPTLAVTTPAKYMYRSAANFNVWALMQAKRRQVLKALKGGSLTPNNPSTAPSINSTANGSTSVLGLPKVEEPQQMSPISPTNGNFDAKLSKILQQKASLEDDLQSELTDSSVESSGDEDPEEFARRQSEVQDKDSSRKRRKPSGVLSNRIIVSGNMPSFGSSHIIRQRASCHGKLRQMEPEEEMEALQMSSSQVGRVDVDGPVGYWLATRDKFHKKYAKELQRYRKIKSDDYAKAIENGFLTRDLHDDRPPRCALASWYDLELARQVGKSVDEVGGKSNAAVSLYMKISQRADREQVGDVTDTSRETIQLVKSRQAHVT